MGTDECIEATLKIVDAINTRPVTSPAHLVDLAIVARLCSRDRGYDDDIPEGHEAAHTAIVRHLLQAAGIGEAACSINNPAFVP